MKTLGSARLFFRIVMLALIICSIPLTQPHAQEIVQTKSIEVIGCGTGTNVGSARDMAIKNGIVTALQLSVVELIPHDKLIVNFDALNRLLFEQSDKFVQNYRVLTEFSSGTTYRVMVEVTLSMNLIKEELTTANILVAKTDLPKILFVISEQNIDDPSPKFWWGDNPDVGIINAEESMVDVFRSNGFETVDHTLWMAASNDQHKVYAFPIGQQDAKELALQLNAGIVIIGRAYAETTPNTMGEDIHSFKGTVNAVAIVAETGQELGSAIQTSITVNKDGIVGGKDAIKSAASLVAEILCKQISENWQKKEETTSTFKITIEGTQNLANFVKFRKTLQNLPGMNEFKITEMDSNQAFIQVQFEGGAQSMANKLMLKNFDSFGIQIYDISEQELKVRLIPRQ